MIHQDGFFQHRNNLRTFECSWYITRCYGAADDSEDEVERVLRDGLVHYGRAESTGQVVGLPNELTCRISSVARSENCVSEGELGSLIGSAGFGI